MLILAFHPIVYEWIYDNKGLHSQINLYDNKGFHNQINLGNASLNKIIYFNIKKYLGLNLPKVVKTCTWTTKRN